jgi:phenylacetate-coenzyme A ligase PaaK-like adenylate-forming protein
VLTVRVGTIDPAPDEAWPEETGPEELTAVSRALAATAGGQVVASGGTTGKLKLTTIAHHQGIPRLLRSWCPLRPGDVLLNLFRPGRLWGAHYFYHALAAHCACSVLPMGPLSEADLPAWSATFADVGVTALAGAPSVLADFAAAAVATGTTLDVRAVVWAGEPLTPARRAAITSAFPAARFWGNYGSIETYVIGTNRPDCDPGVLHLLPDQVLEVSPERALLTRTGDGWPVPAVRYRLGDRVEAADCPCGDGDSFRVLGRADDRVKFFNTMLRLGDVLDVVRGVDGVADAQLALTVDGPERSAVAELEVRYVGAGCEPAVVRAELLRRVYALEPISRQRPGLVRVARVTELDRNERTGKVPPQVWTRNTKGAGT